MSHRSAKSSLVAGEQPSRVRAPTEEAVPLSFFWLRANRFANRSRRPWAHVRKVRTGAREKKSGFRNRLSGTPGRVARAPSVAQIAFREVLVLTVCVYVFRERRRDGLGMAVFRA